MRENVFVCPSCPEPRKQMHLCDLREHIAEVHLDHFHTYFCPKCKEKFATAFKAHKHIREICRVEGVVPMHEYTPAMLSYDSAYLTKMYELELSAIFKYVSACDRRPRPKTVNVRTNTESFAVDVGVQAQFKTAEADCQTEGEARGTFNDFLTEPMPFASPTDEEPQERIENRPIDTRRKSEPARKVTVDQGTVCSSAEIAAATGESPTKFAVINVKQEPNAEKNAQEPVVQAPPIGESTTKVGAINVKQEPIAEKVAQEPEPRVLAAGIKQEPRVDEMPPPASPESNNSSVNVGPPSEFDGDCMDEYEESADVKGADFTEGQAQRNSTDVEVDAPCTSHALPDLEDDIQIIEPEDWEKTSPRATTSRSTKRKNDDQMNDLEQQPHVHQPPQRLPSLLDWDILSPNLSKPEQIFRCMKVVQENSIYSRIVNEDHVCEYEDCCQPSIVSNCMFCYGSHYSSDCSSYATLDDRKEIARRRSICSRCGKAYHGHCNGTKCTFCHKMGHHAAFCWSYESRQNMSASAFKNFPRWLPKIAESEALNRRREKIKSPRPERPARRRVNEDSPMKKRRRNV